MIKDNDTTADFAGIVNRQYKTCESTASLSVTVAEGCAKVGDCYMVETESGIVEARLLSINTKDGYRLEAHAGCQTLMTFDTLPVNVIIPGHGIVSAKGHTMAEYASMPLEITVLDTFKFRDTAIAVVCEISRGTVRIDDEIRISNDGLDYVTRVEDIECLKKFHEQMSYGGSCALILCGVPDQIRRKITRGSRITTTRDC